MSPYWAGVDECSRDYVSDQDEKESATAIELMPPRIHGDFLFLALTRSLMAFLGRKLSSWQVPLRC
jgi:hypothetical protein